MLPDCLCSHRSGVRGDGGLNIGFWMCIALGSGLGFLALVFGIMKENAAKLVAGFNDLPKKEQEQYDKVCRRLESLVSTLKDLDSNQFNFFKTWTKKLFAKDYLKEC